MIRIINKIFSNIFRSRKEWKKTQKIAKYTDKDKKNEGRRKRGREEEAQAAREAKMKG